MKNFLSICLSIFVTPMLLLNDLAAQEPPNADNVQNVIMVLDGSGSMWGQIDGKAKIDIAREVIGDLLGEWDSNIHLGLVAYGHREKGVCEDIETLAAVGPVNADVIMEKVNAINPVGKTPISASVLQAAEALKYTEEKATVILISDGLETCDADPCALATELGSKGIDFTAHVIGFDLGENDQSKLSCLAENTGGVFINTQSANELTVAMTQTVEVVKKAEPEFEPEIIEKSGAQGVKLIGKLCDACEPLENDILWRVQTAEKNLDGKRKRVKSNGNPSPFITLTAGDYYVLAKYGEVERGVTFSVAENETTNLVVNLEAGNLRVDAIPVAGAEVLEDKMLYRVFEEKANLDGKRKQVVVSSKYNPVFRLPAGDYLVRAKHGTAETEATLKVTAGELSEHRFTMDVGYLQLATRMVEGGENIEKGVLYRVMTAKKNLEGKRKQLDVSSTAEPLFRLPAGDYVITAKHGKAVTETPISVTAGEMVEMVITQNTGRIKGIALLQADGAPIDSGVFWRVYKGDANLEGKRQQVDVSSSSEPVFTLPEGDYILTVKFGEKILEKNFTIAAGEEKQVEINLSE